MRKKAIKKAALAYLANREGKKDEWDKEKDQNAVWDAMKAEGFTEGVSAIGGTHFGKNSAGQILVVDIGKDVSVAVYKDLTAYTSRLRETKVVPVRGEVRVIATWFLPLESDFIELEPED